MIEDRALFPEQPAVPAPKPAKKRVGKGSVSYAPSRVKQNCDDCSVAVYELLMAGNMMAPMLRRARYKRTQGDLVLLLCSEHYYDRLIEEMQ